MIFTSEAQLRYAVNQYLEYWNHYRPHAELGGAMVMPYTQDMDAPIKEVYFLGGTPWSGTSAWRRRSEVPASCQYPNGQKR